MPKSFKIAGMILAMLALVPFVLVARARATKSEQPRVHLIPDMDNQPKFKPQAANRLFADQRAMRPRIPGTIAQGDPADDDHFLRGRTNGEWAATFPPQVRIDDVLLRRGQQQYNIFCAPCHGLSGYGDGMVARRADRLEEGKWVPPLSYHTDDLRQRRVGDLYNTIANGIRTMPAYGPQIAVEDRWAIVAYLRALQRSQNARIEDVPAEVRSSLR